MSLYVTDKKIEDIFIFLEGVVKKAHKNIEFKHLDELKKISRKFSKGSNDNFFIWHLFFNFAKLRDNKYIFLEGDSHNVKCISAFNGFIDPVFKDVAEKIGVSTIELKCIFNNYLINKYSK